MATAARGSVSPYVAGLTARCPRCGQGKLFDGFLTLRPRCSECGLDYSFADAGDGPAVFVMFIAGFIVVGTALVVEIKYAPPLWVHALLWVPLKARPCRSDPRQPCGGIAARSTVPSLAAAARA